MTPSGPGAEPALVFRKASSTCLREVMSVIGPEYWCAKVKHDLPTGSQQVHVDHPLFGELDIGITQQYKHLGSINAGPHKYDQEVEARTTQAKASTKSLRTIFCAERPPQEAKTNSMESACVIKANFSRCNIGNNDS